MLKQVIKRYTFIMMVLGLAACEAYIEDDPLTGNSEQSLNFPGQANKQSMQMQSMQQRRPGTNNSGTSNSGTAGVSGSDESRMQQTRVQSAGSIEGGKTSPSSLAPGGIIGPRTAAQQKAATQPSATVSALSTTSSLPAESSSASAKPVNKESLNKGRQLYTQKDFNQAVKELDAFIKENEEADEVPEALLYLGNSYFELQNWEKAALAYKRIDQHYYPYPLAPQASLKLAQCYENMGQPKLAEAVRKNMKDKYPPGSYELPVTD